MFLRVEQMFLYRTDYIYLHVVTAKRLITFDTTAMAVAVILRFNEMSRTSLTSIY